MVNLEFSQKHDERFEKHFNSSMDDITLTLKCHLLLEEMLRDFCSKIVPQPQYLADSRLTFAQVLDLSRALYPTEVKLGFLAELWPVAEKINRVRNMMAHSLDPDAVKLEAHKLAIMGIIRSRFKNFKDSSFSSCLAGLLGAFSFLLQVGVTYKNGEDILKIPKK